MLLFLFDSFSDSNYYHCLFTMKYSKKILKIMRRLRRKNIPFTFLVIFASVAILIIFCSNQSYEEPQHQDLSLIPFENDPYLNLSIPNMCPRLPFIRDTKVSISLRPYELEEIEAELKPLGIKEGGLFSPSKCQARQRVAIIVPYRYRERNRKVFIRHMHKFLSDQLIEYGIYLVEPVNSRATFNRGRIFGKFFLLGEFV